MATARRDTVWLDTVHLPKGLEYDGSVCPCNGGAAPSGHLCQRPFGHGGPHARFAHSSGEPTSVWGPPDSRPLRYDDDAIQCLQCHTNGVDVCSLPEGHAGVHQQTGGGGTVILAHWPQGVTKRAAATRDTWSAASVKAPVAKDAESLAAAGWVDAVVSGRTIPGSLWRAFPELTRPRPAPPMLTKRDIDRCIQRPKPRRTSMRLIKWSGILAVIAAAYGAGTNPEAALSIATRLASNVDTESVRAGLRIAFMSAWAVLLPWAYRRAAREREGAGGDLTGTTVGVGVVGGLSLAGTFAWAFMA